jgi:DNA ligase-associated metallophosphoesterase
VSSAGAPAGAACTGAPGGVTVTEWALRPDARLQLRPQRAAFDPDRGLLLVADAHIGKAQSFRRLGVPVPHGTTAEALARLDALLAATDAQHLVFLGDFLHSRRSHAPGTMDQVAVWRERHRHRTVTLVRGNHDDRAGDPPARLGITVVDGPLHIGPWALQHHPRPVPGAYALAGHLHPGIVLGGRMLGRLRLPCFHFGTAVGVLPAFGPFTGLHVIQRAAGERVFALADDVVREV